MPLEFRPIALDVDTGDSSGMLVLRDGALLGELHGVLAGRWYIEVAFHSAVSNRNAPFADISAVSDWLSAKFS